MHKWTVAALAALSFVTGAAEPPVLVPIARMSLDIASRAATAAIAACREQGVNVAVTVLDRGGRAQVVMRDTLAMPLTLVVSEHKAYAALNFNAPTSELEGRFTSPFSPGKTDGLILSAGALPITAGGSIVGAIGVSGAPSGQLDEACARAGLDAVSDDLEMAM